MSKKLETWLTQPTNSRKLKNNLKTVYNNI